MRDHDLWLVLAGTGRGRVAGSELMLRPGTLIVFRPGDEGAFHQDSSDRLTVVAVHFEFVQPHSGKVAPMPGEWLPSRIIDMPSHARLSELLHRTTRLSRHPDPLAGIERASVFLQALLEVYRQDARARGHHVMSIDPRIQDAMDLVRYEAAGRPPLSRVAGVAGLSPDYFSRIFSEQVGVSFRKFVLQARMERGFELLSETPMTVAQVAQALGYDGPFLFSRQFREHYGCPPSQIRTADP